MPLKLSSVRSSTGRVTGFRALTGWASPRREKLEIGRPSCPRWELDIVAYKASSNEILMVECKSYLDSYGVRFSGFDGSNSKEASRYKIFNDGTLRRVVRSRMVHEMCAAGLATESPDVRLVLVCGKIKSDNDRGASASLLRRT